MKVKDVEKTANVAWSPKHIHPIYIVAGTAAQQLDSSFSTSATIEVYTVNLADPGNDLNLITTQPSEQRFHKLAWSGHSASFGTIVGGCDSGLIQIYNATKLLKNEDGLVSKHTKHTGAVRALDFNAYQSNLLASGAAGSEIYIWDLNNPSKAMTPGASVQPPEDLMGLAWNKQVQHILATAFPSRCVVWDLRKSEPIIKLTDTACRLRWSAVAWNPDVATQLCLASEEDQSPFIQLWDLRFATSPVKVLEGHQKGVLSISWCAQDTEMLLSCGKDNKIFCWNPNTTYQGGELICDMTTLSQWNFDVSWCPRNPALFSTCSFDGHVSICSMLGAPQQPQTSTKIADSFPGMELYTQAPPPSTVPHPQPVDLRKPPKWLRRPATAKFGFGGKLVITESKTVTLCQVTAEPGLVARANLLDAALRADNCVEFCQGKVAASSNDTERTLWQFLTASFATVPREEYLDLLGFRREDISAKLSKIRLRHGSAGDRLGALGRSTDTESDLDGSDDIGDHRGILTAPDGSQASPQRFSSGLSNGLPIGGRAPRSYKISTTDDVDGVICEALLLGDIETAVELCVEDARWADAIILAMTGGSDLLASTQHRYLQENSGCLSKLISAVVTEDWTPVIQNCDTSSWKEALVAALTHSSEDFPVLCEALGERLDAKTAQLCFLCAGNLGKLVSAWMSVNSPAHPDGLQDLVEIIMLLKRAVELRGRTVDLSGIIAELLSRYAIILASEGNLEMALSYLGTSCEEQIAMLRERLYYSLGLRQPPQPVETKAPAQPAAPRNRSLSSSGYGSGGSYNPTVPAFAEPSYNLNRNAPRIGSPALATGMSSRAKHVLDPSVASAPAPTSFYSNSNAPATSAAYGGFQPAPVPNQAAPFSSAVSTYQPTAATTPAYTFPGTAPNTTPANCNSFQGPAASCAPPGADLYNQQPPGWNDPPVFTRAPAPPGGDMAAQHAGTRKWKEVISHNQKPKQEVAQKEPITSPLMGGAPAPVNGMYDPYQQNQNQYQYQAPGGAYPPPATQASFPPPPTQNQYPPPPSQGQYPPPATQASFPPPPTQNQYPPPPSQAQYPPPPSQAQYPPPSSQAQFPPPPSQVQYPPPAAQAQYPPPTPTQYQQPTTGFSATQPPSQPSFYPPPQIAAKPSPLSSQSSFPPTPASQSFPPQSSMPPTASQPAFPPPPSNRPPSQPPASFPSSDQQPTYPSHQEPQPSSRPPSQPAANTPLSGYPPSQPVPSHRPSITKFPTPPPLQSQFNATKSTYPAPTQSDFGGHPAALGSFPSSQPVALQSVKPPTPQPTVRRAIPEKDMHLQTVLEELRNRCTSAASNPQSKRKLDDVARKLEALYDSLAEGRLSDTTLQGFHGIAQNIQNGDYTGGLLLHTKLVSGPDFSQIAPFMSGIKVLLQTALQLQVYL